MIATWCGYQGGQIRPTSSNPEDYVVHDIILWDPLSGSSNIALCYKQAQNSTSPQGNF